MSKMSSAAAIVDPKQSNPPKTEESWPNPAQTVGHPNPWTSLVQLWCWVKSCQVYCASIIRKNRIVKCAFNRCMTLNVTQGHRNYQRRLTSLALSRTPSSRIIIISLSKINSHPSALSESLLRNHTGTSFSQIIWGKSSVMREVSVNDACPPQTSTRSYNRKPRFGTTLRGRNVWKGFLKPEPNKIVRSFWIISVTSWKLIYGKTALALSLEQSDSCLGKQNKSSAPSSIRQMACRAFLRDKHSSQSCPWVRLTHWLGWVGSRLFQFSLGWIGLGPL